MRWSARIWALVVGLIGLQFVILAAGIAGIITVDTVRSYVAGENHYSRGEKQAVYHLRAYVLEGSEDNWTRFQQALAVPKASGLARILLERPEFDIAHAVNFLIKGGLTPADAPAAAWGVRLAGDSAWMAPAMATWKLGDANIQRIEGFAQHVRAHWTAGSIPFAERRELAATVDGFAERQTAMQRTFGAQLSSRAVEVRAWIISGMVGLTCLVSGGGAWVTRLTIHRLQAAERDLNAERRLFQDIAHTASDWIWATDANLRFTFFSDRMAQITHTPKEAVLGLTPADLRANDGSPAWADLWAAMQARQPFQNFEYQDVDSNGRRHWYRISGTPHLNADGAFAGYRGTGTDITEEVNARDECARRWELLETTFETVPHGITVVDGELKVKAFNRHFMDLMGYPPDEFQPGTPFERFIRYNAERGEYGPLHDIDGYVDDLVARARRFEPHHFERVRPDGTVLEIRGAPLPSGGFVTSYADITEHRRAQSELAAARDQAERASAAKSQFLANMSHELRTPLNAVIGYSDIMAMELFGPLGHARYQEYVRSIHTSGSYLLALIEDVLSLSRIEAESTDVTPLALDLVSLVDETLTVLGTLAGGRVAVETPARADVLADRRAVLQILVNVVGNALKFSGNRPVDLSVSEGQTTVTVEVTDRGDGIPESELQRITEPFYTRPRNSMVAADENEGCGLGLAITQKLLDALGARMMVASAEGQGTTVTIELPRAHSQAYPDTNPLDVAGGASGPHDPPSETAAAE